MKLLASVLSVAAADYACCPYDDYGMPETSCVSVLTEKSPFATADINEALVAQESFACKAWEANAGAANENHKAATVNDWGSCGFQRHFPWYNKKPTAATDPLVKIGLFKATGQDPTYEVFGTGGSYGSTGTNWNMLSLTQGSFSGSAAGNMPITGEVHLGGVCKLFVPVQMDYIRQVSVAGVHINNARIFAGTSRAFSAEMNAVVVGKTAAGTASTPWTGKFHAGTAYCFSVVNIAEFMTNRANLIANANVAGTDTRTAAEEIWYGDDQGLQYKTNGNTESAQFGTIWPGYDGTTDPSPGTAGQKTSGQHKVNMGSNFDVVVHFDSAWCSAHWTHVDMQKDQDHGAGTNTDTAGDNLKGFNNGAGAAKEAMMDAWDKRLPGDVGSCGLCMDHSQVTPGASIADVTSKCADNTWTAGTDGVTYTMGQTEGFNYHGTPAVPSNCVNINEYTSGTDNRWPNAGAWAAFYSFVTCARSDYMIYGFATRTLRTVTLDTPHQENVPASNTYNEAGSATHSDKDNVASSGKQNNDNRMIVVGGWHQDYRHGQGTCVRFNLRQVGENVKYCADGDEEQFNAKDTNSLYKNPTGDTKAWSQDHPNRCTWNWNYKNLANTYDAEAWFDSIDPLHMQVWEVNAVSQTAAEKFIDEPLPGATNTAGFQAAVVANTLTSPVVINVLMQERRRKVNGGTAGTYVDPSNLVMDSSHAVVSALTHFAVGATPGADYIAFDNTSGGSTAKITLSCDTAAKYNGGSAGSARMRDHFPDCFFGDELHGQWEWSTGLSAVDGAANTAVWKFWAMLHSH